MTPPELDRAIDEVIHKREYTWRIPRENATEERNEPGTIAAFFRGVWDTVVEVLRSAVRWIEKLFRALFRSPPSGGSGATWVFALHGLVYLLAAGILITLAILLWRIWRRHQRSGSPEVMAQAVLPAPDVADENVGADQLPEDGWLRLARELLERGELRLALRAFYLASLAHLAARNLITLARFKSNRDYERELGRRAHALPDVLNVFTQNGSAFDRAWYGMHEVSRDLVQHFASNVERIRAA